MNKTVEAYLDAQKKAERERYEKKKAETLISLGIYEKEYSLENTWSEEYNDYEEGYADTDNEYKVRWFKKIPVEVSDEEYVEILKHSGREAGILKSNPIATTLKVIAWIVFAVGALAGIIIAANDAAVAGFITIISAFISGMMFLGFAEIIKLLNDIKNK